MTSKWLSDKEARLLAEKLETTKVGTHFSLDSSLPLIGGCYKKVEITRKDNTKVVVRYWPTSWVYEGQAIWIEDSRIHKGYSCSYGEGVHFHHPHKGSIVKQLKLAVEVIYLYGGPSPESRCFNLSPKPYDEKEIKQQKR